MTIEAMNAVATYVTMAGIAAMLCALLLTALGRGRSARPFEMLWHCGRLLRMAKITWTKGQAHTLTLGDGPAQVPSNYGNGVEYLWKVQGGQCFYASAELQARLEACGVVTGDCIEIQRSHRGWDVRRAYAKPMGESGMHQPVSAPRMVPPRAPAEPVPLIENVRAAHPMAVALAEAMHAARIADFQGTTEDIRAIAITIFIERNRSQGNRAAA